MVAGAGLTESAAFPWKFFPVSRKLGFSDKENPWFYPRLILSGLNGRLLDTDHVFTSPPASTLPCTHGVLLL